MSNQWTIPITLFAVWLLVDCLLQWGITRVLWNKSWRGPQWVPSFLESASLTWRILMGAVVFILFFRSQQAGGGRSRNTAVESIVVMWVWLMILILFSRMWMKARMVKGGLRIGTQSLWKRLSTRKWSANDAFVVLPLIFLVVQAVPGARAGIFLVYLPFFFLIYDSFRRRKAAPAGMVEMEDTPLLAEIRAICSSFGRKLQQVFVQPYTGVRDYQPLPLFVLHNPYGESRPRLVVPTELLQSLNPSAFTAALAFHYAKSPTVRISDSRVINPMSPLLVGGGFALVMVVVFWVTAMWRPGVSPASAFIGMLVPLGVLLLVRAYFALTLARAYRAAYQIWCDSDSYEKRTVSEFVCGLAEFQAVQWRMSDMDLVLHQMRLKSALHRFIRESGEATPEEVFEAVHAHLRSWAPQSAQHEANAGEVAACDGHAPLRGE